MFKLENFEVVGFEAAIRGMHNSMNSLDESDSGLYSIGEHSIGIEIGDDDYDLITRLRNAGMEYNNLMRMIIIYVDITAPLYWWKEFDAYKVGMVTNSCGTMDNIMDKEFTVDDFSHGHLFGPDDMYPYDERRDPAEDKALAAIDVDGNICYYTPTGYMKMTCKILNHYRNKYLEVKSKPMKEDAKRTELMEKYWWQVIQLLPSSYNQKRTVMLNYEALANMYRDGKAYKLDEWAIFRKWIEKLPYSEIITGGKE